MSGHVYALICTVVVQLLFFLLVLAVWIAAVYLRSLGMFLFSLFLLALVFYAIMVLMLFCPVHSN